MTKVYAALEDPEWNDSMAAPKNTDRDVIKTIHRRARRERREKAEKITCDEGVYAAPA